MSFVVGSHDTKEKSIVVAATIITLGNAGGEKLSLVRNLCFEYIHTQTELRISN